MALSGLDIYKVLPKTNCRECGFATCLAFAMALAKKTVGVDKCPYLSQEAKGLLEASAQPPIRLVSIGCGESKLEIGNDTVMFRHEEKFYNPCGIGFIIEDDLEDTEIRERLKKINNLKFERVGQKLGVNLVAVKQKAGAQRFLEVVKLVSGSTTLPLVIMSSDLGALRKALEITAGNKPLIYAITKDNLNEAANIAKEFKVPAVVSAPDLETVSGLTQELTKQGLNDLVLDTGRKLISDKIWDLTQIRRQALKKSNRSLGFPAITIVEDTDPFKEAIEAAAYICKYSNIVLLKRLESWEVLALLTVRQNIYTDPQKPLQIEPNLYPVGAVGDKSPVIVTTNFSLTYYTVLGEVEASKLPSYILSVDTEGMSVLTAWAAEKFTADKIVDSMNKFGLKDKVAHNKLIIPGYVAVMSGDLEEKSGANIIVGPKEAAGIPSFLKNLQG